MFDVPPLLFCDAWHGRPDCEVGIENVDILREEHKICEEARNIRPRHARNSFLTKKSNRNDSAKECFVIRRPLVDINNQEREYTFTKHQHGPLSVSLDHKRNIHRHRKPEAKEEQSGERSFPIYVHA